MNRLPLRRTLCAIVIGVWWLLVVICFARVPVTAPLLPQVVNFSGDSFIPAIGSATAHDGTLRVSAAGGASDTMQTRTAEIFDATRYASVRYSLADFPATMELVLVFRRADQPNDVRTIALPAPRWGSGSADLSREPEWRGEVIEIGLAAYPAAQSVPPESAFQPFAIRAVQLWTPSWLGSLAVAWHDWIAPRSWTLMSISALGPDAATRHGRSLQLLVVTGIVGSLAFFQMLSTRPRRRLLRAVLLALAAGWVLLDLRWLVDFFDRHAATRAIYAGLDSADRQKLVPDSTLAMAAARVRETMSASPQPLRAIVDAGSDYQRARLIYHLLPMNVAPGNLFPYVTNSGFDRIVLVLYGVDSVVFDPDASVLTYLDGHSVGAVPLLEDPPLRIYRLQSGAGQ